MLSTVQLCHALLAQRAQLTSTAIASKSTGIALHVGALSAFLMRHTVMGYQVLAQEVQTTPIIACARQHQQRLVVPRIVKGTLMAMALPEAAGKLLRNRFGILEPTAPLASVPLEKIGYIAIPGIAFDHQSGRLGFGKGYYDRFWSQLPPTALRSGLACSLHVVAHVPQEAHAIPMHSFINEQGVIPSRHSLPVVSSGLGPVAHKGDPIVE